MAFFVTPDALNETAVGPFEGGMERRGGPCGRKRPWIRLKRERLSFGRVGRAGAIPDGASARRAGGWKRVGGYPVSRNGTLPTRERIWPGRPSDTCPSANAIMMASANPTRVFIAAWPRM